MDDRLIELETKVSFLEDTCEKLQAAFDEQTRAFYALQKEFATLRDRVESMSENQVMDQKDEAPPPHY